MELRMGSEEIDTRARRQRASVCVLLEPGFEFLEGPAAMGDLVLLFFWHLGVGLAFVLKC